jgi:hypothetical protein
MRRVVPLLLLLLAGCSTAPVADFLDFFFTGRPRQGDCAPFGGVCIPQGGPILAPVVPAPAPAPAPPVPAPAPVVPAPVTPGSPFLPPLQSTGKGASNAATVEVPVTRQF